MLRKASRCSRKLLARLIIATIDRSFFECSVHSLNLAVGPRVIELRELVFNTVLWAKVIKGMSPEQSGWTRTFFRKIRERDAVIRYLRMVFIGHRIQKLSSWPWELG